MPHWSRDGRSIYYASDLSGARQMWKKSIDGGAPVQVTLNGGASAQESFDGRDLYFSKGDLKPGLWRQPLAGGPEEEIVPQLSMNMWGNWRVTRSAFLS